MPVRIQEHCSLDMSSIYTVYVALHFCQTTGPEQTKSMIYFTTTRSNRRGWVSGASRMALAQPDNAVPTPGAAAFTSRLQAV